MQLFYEPTIASNPVLDETETKHATKVLRLGLGDDIQVVDGLGNLFTCEISEINKRSCTLAIRKKESFPKPNKQIHIAIAPTKNQDRIEWFVEKCIEIGVQEITFINCKRNERSKLNMERIHRIAVSAMKQSLNYWMPTINGLVEFKPFLASCKNTVKMIAHLNEGERQVITTGLFKGTSYCMLIGPEGDFTDNEVQQAIDNGFVPVSLGESRLRTETAGMVSCVQLNLL